MKNATFFHAACPVCLSAEQDILSLIDTNKFQLEIVDFANGGKNRIPEAEALGVTSVPALVVNGQVLHINFGASLEDVKKAVN